MIEQSSETIATIFERLGRPLDAKTTDEARERVASVGRRVRSAAAGRAESPIPTELRDALGLPVAAPSLDQAAGDGEMGTARFEMHVGATVVPIEVTVDLTTNSPYRVISGAFFFPGIEFSHWRVTDGSVGFTLPDTSEFEQSSDALVLIAQLLALNSDPTELTADTGDAPTVTLLGWQRPPAAYPGVYSSGAGLFFHTTLFMGWQSQV